MLPLNYGKGVEARAYLRFYQVSLLKLPILPITKTQEVHSALLMSWSEHALSNTIILVFSLQDDGWLHFGEIILIDLLTHYLITCL